MHGRLWLRLRRNFLLCMLIRLTLLHATMMNGGDNNDNDTKQSALSPLVTAQDRKRMILEWRRKEREQQSRDDISM